LLAVNIILRKKIFIVKLLLSITEILTARATRREKIGQAENIFRLPD